jgi:hypothetical protein
LIFLFDLLWPWPSFCSRHLNLPWKTLILSYIKIHLCIEKLHSQMNVLFFIWHFTPKCDLLLCHRHLDLWAADLILRTIHHPIMVNICTKLFCNLSKNEQDIDRTKFLYFYKTFDLLWRWASFCSRQLNSTWRTFVLSYIKIHPCM